MGSLKLILPSLSIHSVGMDFPTLPRPAFLNGNDAFNISKPFSVGDRLEALAYQMSVAPPQANELVMPPSVSASKSTTYMVEKDHKCTVRPLRAPPPDFIQEILPMEIDLTPSSPLTIAIEGSDLSRLFTIRGRITMPTMPRESTPDRDENDYLPIVTGALANMVTLAAILLLQQWIHDGANHTDPDAFHRAVGILIYLGPSSVIKDNDCKPDHAAMGPQPENTENQLVITHGSSYAVAMVDRKSRAFAEYRHDPSPNGFRSRTKDGLIQEIIHDGRPFCRIWKELTSGDIKRGWRVETLHLIAQVIHVFYGLNTYANQKQNFVR